RSEHWNSSGPRRTRFELYRDSAQTVAVHRRPGNCVGISEERARTGGRYPVDLNVAKTGRKLIIANRSVTGNEGIRVNALRRISTRICVRYRRVQGEGVSKGLSDNKLSRKSPVAVTTFTRGRVSNNISVGARRPKHHKRHTQCTAREAHCCHGIRPTTTGE